RPTELGEARRRIAAQEAPEARESQRIRQVAEVDARLRVPLAREREYRVRTRLDPAVDHPREVHAEEGEGRIGHGVDQVAYEAGAVRAQLVVLAAKGDDAQLG